MLLIIRTLFLILLILLFAGPFKGYNPGMDPSRKNISVIYFDTSPSMGDQHEGTALIDISRELAANILKTAGADDLFYILTSNPEERFNGVRSDALKFISGTELFGRERDPEEIIDLADSLLFEYPDRNRMMLFFTDGFLKKEFSESIIPAFPMTAFVARHASGLQSYSGIKTVEYDGSGTLEVIIRSSVQVNYYCEVFFDGIKIHSGNTVINESGTGSFFVNIPEDRKAFSSITVRSQNALNILENSFYLVIPEIEKKRILITGSTRSQTVSDFQALARVSGNQYDLKLIDREESGSVAFSDYDLILITEMTGINSFVTANYKRFLDNGGSLFFVAGDNLNLNDYNSRLVPELGFPSIKNLFRAQKGSYSGIEIKSIDHKIFQNVFYGDRVVPSTVEIYSLYLLDGNGWKTLIEAQNHPLLLEKDYGKGKIFFLTTGTLQEHSNIMRNGIAIPVFLNSFAYLTGKKHSEGTSFLSGDTAEFDKHLYLVPEGRPLKPQEDAYSRIFRLISPGVYDLYDAQKNLSEKIAVNSEREPRIDYTASMKKITDTRIIMKGSNEDISISDLFYGTSIFRHIIIILSILIILEILVVRVL